MNPMSWLVAVAVCILVVLVMVIVFGYMLQGERKLLREQRKADLQASIDYYEYDLGMQEFSEEGKLPPPRMPRPGRDNRIRK